MNVIYANSEEKFVKKVELYPNEDDVLCFTEGSEDEDATDKISKADLINLFKKGEILIVAANGAFVPTALEISEDKARIVVVTFEEIQGDLTAVPQYFDSDTVS